MLDNTSLIVNLIGILLAIVIALLAYRKGTEDAHSIRNQNAMAIKENKKLSKEITKAIHEGNEKAIDEGNAKTIMPEKPSKRTVKVSRKEEE